MKEDTQDQPIENKQDCEVRDASHSTGECDPADNYDLEPESNLQSSRDKRLLIWDWFQFSVALTLVTGGLLWILYSDSGDHSHDVGNAVLEKKSEKNSTHSDLSITPDAHIRMVLDSAIGKRLGSLTVTSSDSTEPVVTATGIVLASKRPGREDSGNFWQFYSPELLTIYADWEKSVSDKLFSSTNTKQVRELAIARETALQQSITRLERLVQSGTEAQNDLIKLRTELLEAALLGRQEVYKAEADERAAVRAEATLALQLKQAGFDPELLRDAPLSLDILSAEVPEALLERVTLGQSCFATFFGLPEIVFEGRVGIISPILSTEKRTLRVIIKLSDPEDRLRPGMFASVGIGNESRAVLRIPASGLVNSGGKDYVFKIVNFNEAEGFLDLDAIAVRTVELVQDKVEVLSGIKAGDKIIANNAILLKPLVSRVISAKSNLPDSGSRTTDREIAK